MAKHSDASGPDRAPLRVVIVGNRDFSRQIFAAVRRQHDVVGIVGPDTDTPSGPSGYRSFHDLADCHDVPVLGTGPLDDPDTLRRLRQCSPDVCICAGWTDIIASEVLAVPSSAFIGVHASKLPRNRGGAPVNWAMIRGEEEVGLSVFEFVEEVDDGDIYARGSVPIQDRDDIRTVYDKVTATARTIVTDTLDAIARDTADPTPQDQSRATYLPQRKPEDGLVDWSRPATALADWVRALTDPYPGAFTFVDGRRLTIWEAEQVSDGRTAEPGTVTAVEPGRGVIVATGDGSLCVRRAQLGEHPRAWADDRATEWGLEPGARIGRPEDFPDWLYTGIRGPDGSFEFETNVSVGQSARTTAVLCSYATATEVALEASFDGRTVFEETVSVEGWESIPLSFLPDTVGVHTVRIAFDAPERDDVRYLKVYARA